MRSYFDMPTMDSNKEHPADKVENRTHEALMI